MKSLCFAVLAAGVLLWPALDDAHAHGGIYPGPGDVVPPNTGNPTPNGPNGPESPRFPKAPPKGPETGPPRGPQTPPGPPAPPAPPTGGGGPGVRRGPTSGTHFTNVGPDLTQWEFWWERNKAPYLRLKDAVRRSFDGTREGGVLRILRGVEGRDSSSLAPSVTQKRDVVTPALERSLAETDNRDILSSCLIALAKVGYSKKLGGICRERMADGDLEVAETALLCLGIARMEEALPLLQAVYEDREKGRRLTGDGAGVHFRKRAFAAYAMGLIAHAAGGSAIKRSVYESLRRVIRSSRDYANRDIPVAGIVAMGLLNPDLEVPAEEALAREAAAFLLAYLGEEGNNDHYRAQCPRAIVELLGRRGRRPESAPEGTLGPEGRDARAATLRREAVARFTDLLKKSGNHLVTQSCVLALGRITDPGDEKVFSLLARTAEGDLTKDLQARHFVNIALARLGTDQARDYLLRRLAGRSQNRDKPWIALGLGLMAHHRIEAGRELADRAFLGDQLLRVFQRTKNKRWQGAFAIALGLVRHREAGPYLQQVLEESNHASLRGYCALALGMMRYTGAKESLNRVLKRSVRQPGLLRQVAVGLGLLGDKSLVPTLVGMLREGSDSLAYQAAIASGLGFVGDHSAVGPLVRMLFDRELAQLSRAFAAAALGTVADKERLPWNSKIGFGLNYRASVETLTGSAKGVLDLL